MFLPQREFCFSSCLGGLPRRSVASSRPDSHSLFCSSNPNPSFPRSQAAQGGGDKGLGPLGNEETLKDPRPGSWSLEIEASPSQHTALPPLPLPSTSLLRWRAYSCLLQEVLPASQTRPSVRLLLELITPVITSLLLCPHQTVSYPHMASCLAVSRSSMKVGCVDSSQETGQVNWDKRGTLS